MNGDGRAGQTIRLRPQCDLPGFTWFRADNHLSKPVKDISILRLERGVAGRVAISGCDDFI